MKYSRHSNPTNRAPHLRTTPVASTMPAVMLCLALLSVVSIRTAQAGQPELPPGLREASCFDVTVNDGTISLLLGRPGHQGDTLNLYYARSKDGKTWSKPVLIPSAFAPPGHLHRGNDPQIAVHGEHVMALWTAKGDGPWGSGPIAVALSDDGGKTWRAGPTPTVIPRKTADTVNQSAHVMPAMHHGKHGTMRPHHWTGAGYRFPATAADDQAFHVVWIYARGEERSIRTARLRYHADTWSTPVTIDPASCACCWNELKVAPDGALVALYRDRDPRDMRAAVSHDGGKTWRQTPRVGPFNWYIDACPHVGGGLALTTGAMWASVWTGHPEHNGAYVFRSINHDESWSQVTKLEADGHAGHHADVAALSPTHAAAVWDQVDEHGGQAVFLTQTTHAGKTWTKPQRLSAIGHSAGYPRIVAVNNRFVVLWTQREGDKPMQLRVATITPVPR